MVNEDIMTALKNGLARGESLSDAKNILISSGYNSKEIEEASRFFNDPSATKNSMDSEKPPVDNSINKMSEKKEINKPSSSQYDSFIPPPPSREKPKIVNLLPKTQTQQQIKQKISSTTYSVPVNKPKPLVSELAKIHPSKSHLKEIILLILLLFLVGCLIVSIVFKDYLLKFLSGSG